VGYFSIFSGIFPSPPQWNKKRKRPCGHFRFSAEAGLSALLAGRGLLLGRLLLCCLLFLCHCVSVPRSLGERITCKPQSQNDSALDLIIFLDTRMHNSFDAACVDNLHPIFFSRAFFISLV
jgi:hypothetical protein